MSKITKGSGEIFRDVRLSGVGFGFEEGGRKLRLFHEERKGKKEFYEL